MFCRRLEKSNVFFTNELIIDRTSIMCLRVSIPNIRIGTTHTEPGVCWSSPIESLCCSGEGHYHYSCEKAAEYIQQGLCQRNSQGQIVIPESASAKPAYAAAATQVFVEGRESDPRTKFSWVRLRLSQRKSLPSHLTSARTLES